MQIPLEIQLKDGSNPPWVEDLVSRKVNKLEQFCHHITQCRVEIERPHEHADSGTPYRVLIDLTVPPDHEIVVDREPREGGPKRELRSVLTDAFEAAERQVKELVERQRGDVKAHPEPRAFVATKLEDEGYGFLRTLDGREIYFHEHAVLDQGFDRLEVGTQVRFEEEMGKEGPQATTVQIVDRPGHRPTGGEVVEAPAGW